MISRLLGASALVSLVVLTVLGIWVTPEDVVQHDYVRLIYIHPALATTM
jgi:hypothetical protein